MTSVNKPDRNWETGQKGESGESGASGGALLIVSNLPDLPGTIEAALGALEHETVVVTSGAEALHRLLCRDFAVVLLDVNMPGMGGLETARLIRQRPGNQHTPLIFISSNGDDVHAIEGYSLGAVDFLAAPVVPAVLRSKVSVFLELHKRDVRVREHADRLMRQTQLLQALTQASLEIHAARSIDQTLQIAADSAREILGSLQACVILTAQQNGLRRNELVISPVGRVSTRNGPATGIDLPGALAKLAACPHPTPGDFVAANLGPLWIADPAVTSPGLVAPLIGRGGNVRGVLVVSGRREGKYTADEEALFFQLTQMAALSVESTLFAEACESNRMKDEFLATLSHELRTPLSSVLGWTQLLKTNMLDADETKEALDIIERNGQMQCKLIDDLLDVSRIVTGKMQLNLRNISLPTVVQAAINVILPAAQAKEVCIETAFDPRVGQISGDPDRLQQALWNLLTNSVKFTPGGKRIEVSLAASQSHAVIRVRDEGEGISPEFLPHVFDRFRQADNTTSRKHGGLGIGLAIVRHVVELHGGSVRAESDGPGRGTTIVITLPMTVDLPGTKAVESAPESGARPQELGALESVQLELGPLELGTGGSARVRGG